VLGVARLGGRPARWAVAASAAATALLVTVGVTLTGEDTGFLPTSVEASAPTSVAEPAEPAIPSVDAPSSAAATDDAATTPQTVPQRPSSSPSSPTSPPTASAASSAPPVGTAAPVPPTTIADPGPDYPTYAGALPDAPFVSFIGDSWTYGAGATDSGGYAYRTGRLLGWTHRVLGVSGSGYVQDGAGTPFDRRILPAVSGAPDVVVIQGSINERDTAVEELAPAVADTLGRLVRAAGPDTAVVVVGASYVPEVPGTKVDRINDTVRAVAARLGLPFVDVAAENWSDPADPSIWADLSHPNDAGAEQIAERLAPVLQAVVAG
jgi:lysophospholipase L1-like esterase